MPQESRVSSTAPVAIRPGSIGVVAVYLFFAAQVARTLTSPNIGNDIGSYIILFALFIILYSLVLSHPNLPYALLHGYLLFQSGLTMALLSLGPEIDSITVLFILLAYQVPLVFMGQLRWIWVTVLTLAIPTSVVVFLGPLRGLSAGLVPMAVSILVPAIVAANEEIERARVQSEGLVKELQETHRQLQQHAGQAEEMAALEERNRLARQLHDSVSQSIFAITLNTRAAQMLLAREPEKVRPQLEQLQALSQDALAQMRQLIAQMRP